MKVLVVDDSEMIRQHVGGAIRAAGHSVVEACDGFEALARVEELPDIGMVILDINMPRMDGIAVLDKLRERVPRFTTPVVVLTTEADPSMMRQARMLGAKAWMTKPVKIDMLLNLIHKLALGVAPGTSSEDASSPSPSGGRIRADRGNSGPSARPRRG